MKYARLLSTIFLTATLVFSAITMTSCATGHAPAVMASVGENNTPTTTAAVSGNAQPVADTSPDPIAATPEAKLIDPLARALTSATFVEHANASLAIDPNDVIFKQCVEFGLQLGQELKVRPLLSTSLPALPPLAIASVDPHCALCVLAAKRKDFEALQSGGIASRLADLNARIAELRARTRDVQKRAAVACAPLLVDEEAFVARLVALFAGLK